MLSLIVIALMAMPFSVLAEELDSNVQPITPPSAADIFFYILLGVLFLATLIIISLFVSNKKFKLKDTDIKRSDEDKNDYNLIIFADENFNDEIKISSTDTETDDSGTFIQ